MQNICDVLDIDYEAIKDKLPTEEDNLMGAEQTLNSVIPEEGGADESKTEGSPEVTTEG